MIFNYDLIKGSTNLKRAINEKAARRDKQTNGGGEQETAKMKRRVSGFGNNVMWHSHSAITES